MSRSESGEAGAETAKPPTAPVDRLGTPEDIARAVCFYADPDASYVTGQAMNVDGGLIMS
jgi:NAD(P)-dependent dehydrogenase (short-subunit alcohol dehydrogenase family)